MPLPWKHSCVVSAFINIEVTYTHKQPDLEQLSVCHTNIFSVWRSNPRRCGAIDRSTTTPAVRRTLTDQGFETRTIYLSLFWASRDNHRMTPPSHSGAEDSVRLLLTKHSACFFSCLWCQVHGISFKRFPRPHVLKIQYHF